MFNIKQHSSATMVLKIKRLLIFIITCVLNKYKKSSLEHDKLFFTSVLSNTTYTNRIVIYGVGNTKMGTYQFWKSL